jgi:hypothetical protein
VCPQGQQACISTSNGNPNCCPTGCTCGTDDAGDKLCVRPVTCSTARTCTTGSDCNIGEVCATTLCPGTTGVCVSTCPAP